MSVCAIHVPFAYAKKSSPGLTALSMPARSSAGAGAGAGAGGGAVADPVVTAEPAGGGVGAASFLFPHAVTNTSAIASFMADTIDRVSRAREPRWIRMQRIAWVIVIVAG